MSSSPAALDRLRRALGNPKPPPHVWQEPYEFDPAHLKRLVALGPADMPEPRDLYDYTEDLLYGPTDIQADLLLWMMPYYLRAWCDDLAARAQRYAGVVERFYPTLARPKVRTALTAAQQDAVARFMREGVLEEIDAQRGLTYSGAGARPYRWIYAHGAYGVLFPEVQALWRDWWGVTTAGRAVALVQFASCLVFDDDDNPVFTPWTQDGGGGPPCLWELAGHLYDNVWLESNVDFLRSFLNPTAVLDGLQSAVGVLASRPERVIADLVLAGARERSDILASRCEELPAILAHVRAPTNLSEWSV